jgi:integrase
MGKKYVLGVNTPMLLWLSVGLTDVLMQLEEPERTLTLLAASTGLRISECLGLQWQNVSFDESLIYVRRTWTCGKVGVPKSKASHAPVPLHP